MGALDFHGRTPSRAGRTLSKLGPGIIDARRLAELLGGDEDRTRGRADTTPAGLRPATPGPLDDLPDEWDEGGESCSARAAGSTPSCVSRAARCAA